MATAKVKKWDQSREIDFTPAVAWDVMPGPGSSLIWTVKPGQVGNVDIPIGTSDNQLHNDMPEDSTIIVAGGNVAVKIP